MITRHVETLFCDDIRHEITGKVSYIGAYLDTLLVKEFPVTIPKLCLFVKIVTPTEHPLHSITLKVFRGDEILAETSADEEQLAATKKSPEESPDVEDKRRAQVARFHLAFSPIQFDGPSILRVFVEADEEEMRGLALRVEKIPQSPEKVAD